VAAVTAVAEARRDDIDIGSAMIDVGSRVVLTGNALADAFAAGERLAEARAEARRAMADALAALRRLIPELDGMTNG
jgi:hypothetical protein